MLPRRRVKNSTHSDIGMAGSSSEHAAGPKFAAMALIDKIIPCSGGTPALDLAYSTYKPKELVQGIDCYV
jgi:hypothetical protein